MGNPPPPKEKKKKVNSHTEYNITSHTYSIVNSAKVVSTIFISLNQDFFYAVRSGKRKNLSTANKIQACLG